MDPQDPQWLNRCVLAILRARSELIPDAISDAYNDFAAVKVTAVFDPSLVRDPYIQHLRRQPDEVLHDLRNRNVVPSGTRQHSRHRVFEHLGHGALYLASLGPMVTLNGIDDALVFINACGNHDVVEQIGERAYHLAAQEVSESTSMKPTSSSDCPACSVTTNRSSVRPPPISALNQPNPTRDPSGVSYSSFLSRPSARAKRSVLGKQKISRTDSFFHRKPFGWTAGIQLGAL